MNWFAYPRGRYFGVCELVEIINLIACLKLFVGLFKKDLIACVIWIYCN